MISKVFFYLSIYIFCIVVSNVKCVYMGENFPEKYLHVDVEKPTETDLHNYLDVMTRITDYFLKDPNNTDVNQAIGTFFAQAVLKRTLRDYSKKLKQYKDTLKSLIIKTSSVMSHYIYVLKKSKDHRPQREVKISKIMLDETANVYSISEFKRNILRNWIRRPGSINKYVSQMDALTLPKETYARLVEYDKFPIKASDSDYCLSRMPENIEPYDITSLRHCDVDEYCMRKIFSSPSVAYTLSHRLLSNMLFLHNRRCYVYSPEYDNMHMDMLCAEMYRETVYLARRGFFYRDLFMEHIGLCGQLGYEEFHRPRWFRKGASWVDEDGCITEFSNFEINRTRLAKQGISDPKKIRKIRQYLDELLIDRCHHHQMAVSMMFFATGIRHAAHYIEDVSEKEL